MDSLGLVEISVELERVLQIEFPEEGLPKEVRTVADVEKIGSSTMRNGGIDLNRRAAITGLGIVTSVGLGREPTWAKPVGRPLRSGPRHGLRHQPLQRAPRRRDCWIRPRGVRSSPRQHIDRSHIAACDCVWAVLLSRTLAWTLKPSIRGTSGSAWARPRESRGLIEQLNDRILADSWQEMGTEFGECYPSHVIAANVACELQIGGDVAVVPTACAAGNHAIAHALDAIRAGRAELVLAGGADAFSRITFSGFARLGAIAPGECQPFDRDRRGMIPGEGAGLLVIERLDRALERGARIYAEVAGYGLSCDAFHMTGAHPEGFGAARAMLRALNDAGTAPHVVDYVSAHGTGTVRNDLVETLAVKNVFGERAYRVPISSVKSMLGHTMGAASAIEAAVCAMAIHDQCIPPTANLETQDPECDLDYVANEAREWPVEVAMNNAYAFGGNNSCVVLRRFAG